MKTKFDTSFARTDSVRRARHGIPWTEDEYANLRKLFLAGMSLRGMCETLQRPADGTLNKLRNLHLITFSQTDFCDYVCSERNSLQTPTPKETTMNKTLVESKTFINGIDATGMSDAEIFRLIAKTEDEIIKLKAIKTVSKKLNAAINKLEEDVVKLAEYVDSRE